MQWFLFAVLALICWQVSALLQHHNDGTSLLVRGLRPLLFQRASGPKLMRRFVHNSGKLFRHFLLWDDRNSSIPDFAFFRAAVRAPPNRT
ncbi:MAG: hypothetical protein IIY12_01550 [Clostridia bacterium]|nr:hypothetical protein [Clostridia bacterium]MBQ1965418.1 hypothetical protein [Clostridia bacterium]MBQ5743043.1 hypothetical protein [Clostridia bacterium]